MLYSKNFTGRLSFCHLILKLRTVGNSPIIPRTGSRHLELSPIRTFPIRTFPGHKSEESKSQLVGSLKAGLELLYITKDKLLASTYRVRIQDF